MYNILVVEDDLIFRVELKAILQSLKNLNILTAATGREALKAALETEIDIFVIDIGLPDMNGVDLMLKLRNTYRREPIIIESCKCDLETRVWVQDQIQNIAYIPKLCLEEKLIQKINVAIKMIGEPEDILLTLNNGSTSYEVEMESILYIEKIKNTKNIKVVSFSKEHKRIGILHINRISLSDVLFQAEGVVELIRCYNSFVINSKKIEYIDPKTQLIYLYNADKGIPLGRKYKKNLKGLGVICYD